MVIVFHLVKQSTKPLGFLCLNRMVSLWVKKGRGGLPPDPMVSEIFCKRGDTWTQTQTQIYRFNLWVLKYFANGETHGHKHKRKVRESAQQSTVCGLMIGRGAASPWRTLGFFNFEPYRVEQNGINFLDIVAVVKTCEIKSVTILASE